jgi:hypothetical protein
MELRNSGTEGMETKKKKKTSPAETRRCREKRDEGKRSF